jgi:hypothetical protein
MAVYIPPRRKNVKAAFFVCAGIYTESIRTPVKRGALQKKQKSRAVIVWFPDALISGMAEAVQMTDSDRSKFIRNAVREKISRITKKAA